MGLTPNSCDGWARVTQAALGDAPRPAVPPAPPPVAALALPGAATKAAAVMGEAAG
eukprot:gene45963-58268_t